ncbi:aspartate aminotransferase family protein [Rubeoparvulum massiliense]|uniref:aspartate aminotransferase family protein n=1 Tax=Rubeoparvulum massiliense TaxID=1631346 RepID=UPI00065E80ED|nr:aspartate aminotransferase family protein [Rubeoparvulum massiliense]
MAMEQLEAFTYSAKMQESARHYQAAAQVLPGGVTANIKYFEPHPLWMEKGKGSKLYDVDQNEYIDYLLCYGALILGHGHPRVNEAVIKQMEKGGTAVFGAPHELETVMARRLAQLYRGIEMVRFTNSGLEATLLAIRIAMAYTGKKKLAKFEGHYHGGYDQVLLSVNPKLGMAGSPQRPQPVPESRGLPDYYVENTIILPFNDLSATEALLKEHGEDLAAVILEPVQGGYIPADEEFMQGLRKITDELGILLIFDEVKTGFRVGLGGAQGVYGITPDLTALGKVLGGGFPIGAIGGKQSIMQVCAPRGSQDLFTAGTNQEQATETLFHSGTYNGHPIVLAAGMATMDVLEEEGMLEQLFTRTQILRSQLEEVYARHGIPMQTVGMGSIFSILLTADPIKNYRDVSQVDMDLRKRIDYKLLELGIYSKPMNRYSMSTAHDEEDMARTVEAHEQALRML